MSQWIETRKESPKDGISVYTKIDDGKSQRNFQYLMKRGNIWFFSRWFYVCILCADALAKSLEMKIL